MAKRASSIAIIVRIWIDKQVKEGKTTAAKAHEFWLKHRHDYLEQLKSWFPIGKDSFEGVQTLRIIISELGIFGEYYIKEYGGRYHVILRGYAAGRRILTGTRYTKAHRV